MNPELEERAKELRERIRGKNQLELANELQKQLSNKFSDLLSVINTLSQYQYERKLENAPILWQEGSTKLLSFEAGGDRSVIFIPSLINKSYILDLSEKRSFVRYLQKAGINTYLVDWGEPEDAELDFTLSNYIERLDKIITLVSQRTNKPVTLAGYCMGGLLALSSALRNKDSVGSLALFATPWDFHSHDFARFNLNDNGVGALEKIIASSEKISANTIQSMFYYLHPESLHNKFESFFSFINDESTDIEEFIALENWVNDGISMPRSVAKTCFIDWVHYNQVANLKWINPAELDIPVFIVNSSKDHIVPEGCSNPLVQMLKNKTHVKINMGHVSMIAGAKAKENIWQPFKNWLNSHGASS